MRPGALFRQMLTGYGVTLGGLFLTLAILAGFGLETIHVGGHPLTGIAGLLGGLATGVLVVLFTTVVNWFLVVTGNWIWRRVAGHGHR